MALAVRTAVVVADTVPLADAVKLADEKPDGTLTDDGTPTAERLLERLTVWPPLGACLSKVTVQLVD